MITGNEPYQGNVRVRIAGSDILTNNVVNVRVERGGKYSVFNSGPDVGMINVVLFYENGETIPSTVTALKPNNDVAVQVNISGTFTDVARGTINDINFASEFNEFTNKYDTRITIFATDAINKMTSKSVPGIVTSATTLNQSWEQRLTTTLQPYFTAAGVSGTFPSTGTEAHVYRLMDNNVDGSLADQVTLACNSVNAMWYVDRTNTCKFNAKAVYPKTGILFTDERNYWTSGNKPANAGSTIYYNIEYGEIDNSFDTQNIYNTVTVSNIRPLNVATTSAGVLTYKDPATIKAIDLPVVTSTYTTSNATSVASYGVRTQSLTTNLFPSKVGVNAYYQTFNDIPDTYCEYQNPNLLWGQVITCQFSNSGSYSGTYHARAVLKSNATSFAVYLGPVSRLPVRKPSIQSAGAFRIRSPYANVKYSAGVEYYDSSGAVIASYYPPFTNLTQNVWTGATIGVLSSPAGAVTWQPRVVIDTTTAFTFTAGQYIQFDEIAAPFGWIPGFTEPMNGDTPDDSISIYDWLGEPGNSTSVRSKNVLYDIANDALALWSSTTKSPRRLTFNANQNQTLTTTLEPTARVDIRNGGTNYTKWIDTISHDITPDNWLITLELSDRPTSWI